MAQTTKWLPVILQNSWFNISTCSYCLVVLLRQLSFTYVYHSPAASCWYDFWQYSPSR